jgi:peptidoglycan/LPS O-acetylase OafA/YrhL
MSGEPVKVGEDASSLAGASLGADRAAVKSPLVIPSVERYVPALDGMRAGAVLMVILAHFGLERFIPGGFGVTAFFWISGFLITGQLVAELDRSGRVDFTRFYIRRFLRLMPAAFVYITIAGIAFTLAGGTLTLVGWLAAFFYGANYYDIFIEYRSLPSGAFNPLGHLWSLAVEEHYYIFWPLLLAMLHRRRAALKVLVGLCVAVVLWRLFLFQACYIGQEPGPAGGICGQFVAYRNYKGTDTRLDSIAWGALVAMLAASTWRVQLAQLLGSRAVQIVALGALLLTFMIRNNEFREVWRYSIQGIALSVLIPAVIGTQSPLRTLLELPLFVWIGRLSYSLYLWHWGSVTFADWAFPAHDFAWLACAVGVTCLGAGFSYYAIERPMIGLRRRAGSHVTAQPTRAS